MRTITLILYLLLTTVLGVATLVEHVQGTAFVTEHIYHSVPFIVLWGALGVLMIFSLREKKNFQVWPKIFLHYAFVVILAGALTTFLTGRKGMIHLRMGEPSFQYVEDGRLLVQDLPFALELDTFYIDYYPGTDAPADYVSVVEIKSLLNLSCEGELVSSQHIQTPSLTGRVSEGLIISMNNILRHKGYRFYQSSYDEDGRGTWLSVNYDPWGTGITYAGYIMLLIAMIGMVVHPQGGFRKLLKKVCKQAERRELVILSLFAIASASFAQEVGQLPVVTEEEAECMKDMQVVYHGRIVPLNTLARDFVRKIHGRDSYNGLSAEQVLLSWQRYPEEWAYVPIVWLKSERLRVMFGLKSEYARMADLVGLIDLPADKELLMDREKVALVMMLQNGSLVRPLPEDGSVKPLGKVEVKAELLYNRIPFTKILFMFNLTMGILLLCFLPLTPPQGKRENTFSRHFIPFSWGRLGWVLFLFSFLFALMGYLLRWYIGGRIPLSNGYETMQFLALCIMVFALLMSRRFRPAIPFGFLLSGFTLLVAYLGQMNPQITPLMPVLMSPWLSLHVSVIMMSYALFAFILLNGVWALSRPCEEERLMLYSRLLLYPAVFLLMAGIFIGAVWANVSWGRYWGWDPKEVWALVTLLIYALPLHAESLSWFRRPKFFHAYLVFAFLSVLITYFGVSFFLGGMHSYV